MANALQVALVQRAQDLIRDPLLLDHGQKRSRANAVVQVRGKVLPHHERHRVFRRVLEVGVWDQIRVQLEREGVRNAPQRDCSAVKRFVVQVLAVDLHHEMPFVALAIDRLEKLAVADEAAEHDVHRPRVVVHEVRAVLGRAVQQRRGLRARCGVAHQSRLSCLRPPLRLLRVCLSCAYSTGQKQNATTTKTG